MNSKIAAVVAVVAIVIAAVAVYMVFSDGDDKRPVVSHELRTELYPDDYVTLGHDSGSSSRTTTTTVVESGQFNMQVTESDTSEPFQMNYFDFMSLVSVSDDILSDNFQEDGTEVIDTPFGRVNCNVWELIDGGDIVNGTLYLDDDNIFYRSVYVLEDPNGQQYTVTTSLEGTSLFSAAPYHSDGVDPSIPPESGDVVDFIDGGVYGITAGDQYRLTCTGTYNGEAVSTSIEYEAASVEGSMTIHTVISRGTTSEELDLTRYEFTEMLLSDNMNVDLGNAVRTETIETIAGSVECNIYNSTADNGAEYTVWSSTTSDVAYKMEIDINGETIELTLSECSLLVV